MAVSSTLEKTQLLIAWKGGDAAALEQLTPLVQAELHHLAKRYMAGERQGHILQTTALVNEAYLRLIDQKNLRWQNRAHFFGIAAQLMRRILIDHARKAHYQKRGGRALRVSLDEAAAVNKVTEARAAELLAVDEALEKLTAMDARKGRLVELRFFGGLTEEETAEVMGISTPTVQHEWRAAKAWLHRMLTDGEDDS